MTTHNLTQNSSSFRSTSLVDEHAELCMGLKTLLGAGVPAEELTQVFERLCDQAEDIQLNHRNLVNKLVKPTASESEALPNIVNLD